MEPDKEDLLSPLINKDDFEFDPKKYIAKRAHQGPDSQEGASEEESYVRSRVRSMSALTDEHEFNPVRKMNPSEYYYLHLWGEDLHDDEDEDGLAVDEDTWPADELLKLKLTEDVDEKRILRAKLEKGHVVKLSNFMVFFTLLKGFIGTGILFLPNGFYNAGWMFAIGALLFSMTITLTSMYLLIVASEKVEGSFSVLGMKALGQTGKYMCDLTLAVSQAGFVTAGSVFVYQNLATILGYRLGMEIPHYWIGIFLFFIYSPLTWVRKIQKFARYHLFADLTVITGVIVIAFYAYLFYTKQEGYSQDVTLFNNNNYLIFIGTAIYAFEGVGIVLPVKDTCENPKDYIKVLSCVVFFVMSIYVLFGGYNYFVYGAYLLQDTPLITKMMPKGDLVIECVMLLYMVNILISFPLVIHPTNMVLESYIFRGMKQSLLRKWLKNISRTLIVAMTIAIGLYLEDTLDRLMSIIGSLACTPVAFLLPACIHFQLVAETKLQKLVDIVIMIASMLLMVFITGYTLNHWND